MAVPGSRMRPRAVGQEHQLLPSRVMQHLSVGQERQLLIRSGSGEPELQGWESERVVMPIAWSQR